ncbi:MAG: cobalamin biosynthesis bifunctional protein CbiET [Deltaproteobacteria bacterium]|jgi:precorrin-6Y C5,15-methyltransferase (decarboxylating)|nr:cobalamin biosynthesis bifunctional protein CbiET [Deltaproteobacteria bacterium]RZO45242.1 MAG: precorrin-6y C5,15-methyltransferase (decarboxylating) subunit CbiE [Pseudomonadota bacterium]HJL93973.1 precorrin-6y C5,15-methyltransferase (decarboxylating) subunit CbiE [SAR324 cluster bacterium]|tara:strand:- start:1195 stop:2454 length:1260 start_codon:yes stop_codon:yes gene_type:complete
MPDITKKWLYVIGIGEDGWDDLSADSRELLYKSEIVIGGERHLKMIPGDWEGERIIWASPIREAVTKILDWRPSEPGSGKKVAVMASGDPLCYGIAAKLLRHLPIEEIWIKPALSTFSLICSRVGWSLPDIETLTIHGRPLEMLHTFVQPGAKLLVLNQDEGSPKQAAELLAARGFGKSQITVLEHLGGSKERQFSGQADSWNHPDGAALNAMAIECIAGTRANVLARIPGLPDDAFLHDGQLTKREIRAATLSRLMPVVDQVLWDVGAGCGSVAIEWMRCNPRCKAVAIEKSESRLKMIQQNAFQLGVPMLDIVPGNAPEVLVDLPAPDAIFIGGGLSGGNMLETCWNALNPGGRLVANAVTLEGEQKLVQWQKVNAEKNGASGDLARLAVSHVETIGKFQSWKEVRSVTQLTVIKCY